MEKTGVVVYARDGIENGIGTISMGVVGSKETIRRDYDKLTRIISRIVSRIQSIGCKFEGVKYETLKLYSREESGVIRNQRFYPSNFDERFEVMLGKIKSGDIQKENVDKIILELMIRYSPGSAEKNKEVSNIIEQVIVEFEKNEADVHSLNEQSELSQRVDEILKNRVKDQITQDNH